MVNITNDFIRVNRSIDFLFILIFIFDIDQLQYQLQLQQLPTTSSGSKRTIEEIYDDDVDVSSSNTDDD